MPIRRIYVASSWRNEFQPAIVNILRRAGHAVFDFRNPGNSLSGQFFKANAAGLSGGFHWSEIDKNWKQWSVEQYVAAMSNSLARKGFTQDMVALTKCDTCVLVAPCGRSAHLELGFAAGAGKRTVILLLPGAMPVMDPELMYKMATICTSVSALVNFLDLVPRWR
ncbi:hypothetical protein LCGC14_0427800 [marine sediment metagenome]|uniref:Nucleoside 2-deoxyribosyltransferase n=1 Tax=marine sediment metagenome TaxID=412755 RepID=A0A0F9SP69_9ZZZZ